jgi:hypothetical protein
MSAASRNSNSFEVLGDLSSRVSQTESNEYTPKGATKASKRRRKKTRSTGETYSVMWNPNEARLVPLEPQQAGEAAEEIFCTRASDDTRSLSSTEPTFLSRVMSEVSTAKVRRTFVDQSAGTRAVFVWIQLVVVLDCQPIDLPQLPVVEVRPGAFGFWVLHYCSGQFCVLRWTHRETTKCVSVAP